MPRTLTHRDDSCNSFRIYVTDCAASRRREAAVVGVDHPVLGEVPRAHVVLVSDSTVDGAQLRAFLSEQLADYKVPRDYRVETELPRNALGKVLKRQLREQASPPESEPTRATTAVHRSAP